MPDLFLLEVEAAQQHFETNPIYWLLHEAIYCDGGGGGGGGGGECGRLGGPSGWAAERVQASLGEGWDYTTRLEPGSPPVQLTGEMVYSWMGDDYAWLRPLKPAAELLAAKEDWGPLYDAVALGRGGAKVAALVSFEDIYVERAFSEATARLGFGLGLGLAAGLRLRLGLHHQPNPQLALTLAVALTLTRLLGGRAQLWITNEFQHSGLRDQPAVVFERLYKMAKGEVAIPS